MHSLDTEDLAEEVVDFKLVGATLAHVMLVGILPTVVHHL